MKPYKYLVASWGCLAAAPIAPALAAPLAAPVQTENGLETLYITADRRPKLAQQAGLSAVALSGADLDKRSISDLFALAQATPGFNYSANTVLGQPYIRGVGSRLNGFGVDSSVAIFVDGVYQTQPVAINHLFDIDHVEVLKGPQGTLYGRNATGGAVGILSKRPGDAFSFDGDAAIGNMGRRQFRAAVNAPLGASAAIRLSGMSDDSDGFIYDRLHDRYVGGENFRALRGQLRLDLTEAATLLLAGDYLRDRGTAGYAAKLVAPLAGSPSYLLGGIVPADPHTVLYNADMMNDTVNWGARGELTWRFDGAVLTATTAWRETHLKATLDLDGTNFPGATNAPTGVSADFSQDIIVRSQDSGKWDWLGGAALLHSDTAQTLNVTARTPAPPFLLNDAPYGHLTTDALAAFGEAGYQLTPRLRASLGARVSREIRSATFLERINGLQTGAYAERASWNAVTPQAGLEFKASTAVLAYATVRRGSKSGGFNIAQAQPQPFDAESLWAVEAGVKTSWLDDRLRLNAAAFHYDYRNMQVSVQSPTAPLSGLPIMENAAKSKVQGVELSGQAAVLSMLTLDGGLTALDAHFRDYMSVDQNNPLTNPDRAGYALPLASDVTVNLGADLHFPLAEWGRMSVRADWHYQSALYFGVFQDPATRQPGYGVWNARAQFQSADGTWHLALYGRNLTDKLYAQNRVRSEGRTGTFALWGEPRSYGAQIGVHF